MDNENIISLFSLDNKKKKKKTKVIKPIVEELYTYEFLLKKIIKEKEKNNIIIEEKKINSIKIPNIVKIGSKTVLWINFECICKTLKRDMNHVSKFIFTELCTTGSININNQLKIKGIFRSLHIESLLKKYINKYITCKNCFNVNTIFVKDIKNRLQSLKCNDCNSIRTNIEYEKI